MRLKNRGQAQQLKRIPLVAANWKMNFDHLEAASTLQHIAWLLSDGRFPFNRCEVTVLPSFTSLRSIQVVVDADDLRISYGAQAVSVTNQGAFTGDVSADMLSRLGCKYVLVGHSERRKYHPEDDANIVDQVRAILAAKMSPILCVGESFEERRQGIELDFAVGQVHDVTRDLSSSQAERLLVAYEPVWAIGTGMVATPDFAQQAACAIRKDFSETFGQEVADHVRILYGGSVSSKNALELLAGDDVDGFLVGGAALDPQEFSMIANLTAHRAISTLRQ